MKELGKTGFLVHPIGLGGIPIQRVTAQAVKQIIDAMEAHHMNFIDTARAYTNSESLLGDALFGRREHFFLASKSMAKTYEAMKHDVETSLSNLKTTWIDCYQLHNPRNLNDIEGPLKALIEAREAGLIRHIGITNHSKEIMIEAMKLGVFETIQFPYNFLESQGEEVFIAAKRQGLGTIVMKPLAGGVIENGPLALKYILNNHNIDVVIPGMGSVDEVEQNQSVRPGAYLPEEEACIESMRTSLKEEFCHRCGYCLPCPQGIDIPVLFTFEGYHEPYHLQISLRMKRIQKIFEER